jgi:hypothetical protein
MAHFARADGMVHHSRRLATRGQGRGRLLADIAREIHAFVRFVRGRFLDPERTLATLPR